MKSFTGQISDRIPLVELIPLESPLGLCIEPTNRCNLKCSFCPVSTDGFKSIVGPQKDMELDVFLKLVRDLKSLHWNLKRINLYGDGEPLLNRSLERMIQFLIEAAVGGPISVTTNGVLLTRKRAASLVKSGLQYLRLSVYGVDDESYQTATGVPISSNRIRKNVEFLKNERERQNSTTPFIYVKMIDTNSERNNVFLNLYKDTADEVNIEAPMNWNGVAGSLISNIDPSGHTKERELQGYFKGCASQDKKRICTVPFHSLNIKSNGDVTICVVDWNKGTKVGNITESTIGEIWHGDALHLFRTLHATGNRERIASCRNCKFMFSNPDSVDGIPIAQLLARKAWH
jgi:radical SAM protein with 4Fe4S-binding SPASM domain